MSLRNLSLPCRLWITALLALAGSAALLFVSLRTMDTIKIRGPLYQDIVSYKDLLADILPPPAYLIESYLTTLELTRARDGERDALLQKLDKLEADYMERKAVWEKELKHPELRIAMLGESVPPALKFYGIVSAEFKQAIRAGDLEAALRIFSKQLTPAYKEHRAAIDKTVALSNKEVTVVETAADNALNSSITTLLIAALGINLLVLLLTCFSIRSIVRPMGLLTDYAQRVSRASTTASASAASARRSVIWLPC